VIARHPRSYEREDFVFNPLHYLALIEQKARVARGTLQCRSLQNIYRTVRKVLEQR
jgi:hypothetical protein